MVSIIIPARNEPFLQNTINSIINNATGEIEILVGLNGWWPKPAIQNNNKVVIYHSATDEGMRETINNLVRIARGKYIMKCDAHCAFGKGFDEILTKDCDSDWVVIPRRYSLDINTWGIENNGKVRDAHYLSYPTAFINDSLGFGMHIKDWYERSEKRKDILIDDEMVSQGSCWFMQKEYFKPLQSEGYGTFIQEFQEIGLRTWLTGGRVVINKNTWYAHLWKGKKFREEPYISKYERKSGNLYSANFWFNNNLKNKVHNLEWLIDKFWPVPTWPENWKGLKVDFPMIDKNTSIVVDKQSNELEIVREKFKKFDTGKLPIGIPDYTRNDMTVLFKELGYKIGAEIGVKKGEFSQIICTNNTTVKLYCIDPWERYDEYGDYLNPGEVEGFYPEAKNRLEAYNCELIKKYSSDALNDFKDDSLDFVYIDANHRFEYVVEDVSKWSKKVRKGGIISGHDYKVFWKYNPTSHIYEAINGYTQAYRISPWYIFQTRIVDRKSKFNRAGSFMWVKQ